MLVHELAETADTRGQIDHVILDFSKAFDNVRHQRLMEKRNHYGIRGKAHGWIKYFLSGQTQQVIIDGATSEKAPVISGVPEDAVLGLLLFLLFISDLADCVTSSTRLHVFADDCILYRKTA